MLYLVSLYEFPKHMFSLIDKSSKNGFWGTNPRISRSIKLLLISLLLICISPETGVSSPDNRLTKVLLPSPDFPIIPIILPESIFKLIFSKILSVSG